MASEKKTTEVTTTMSKPMQELLAFATELSKSQIVPAAYAGRPSAIFAAIQYGKELGLTPMVSLQNIAVINGKPTLGSDMLLGLAMKHPEWGGYEILEETDKKATVKIYRVLKKLGNKVVSYTASFSVDDARRAGLLNGRPESAWVKWLPNMLLHRAKAFCVRKAFPDAFMGIYTTEEIEPERGARTEEEEYIADDNLHARVIAKEDVHTETDDEILSGSIKESEVTDVKSKPKKAKK